MQGELTAEFNPASGDGWAGSIVATLRAVGVERAGDGWVERVDVAFDSARDPYRVLLDWPRCSSSVKCHGWTVKGWESFSVGYAKGSDRKVRRYDKAREREVNAGQVVAGPWCRVEFEAWGQLDVEGAQTRRDVRLRELAGVRCPVREGGRVLWLVREGVEYADQRYLAFDAVMRVHGTKPCRGLARELLGGSHAASVERMEFVMVEDVTPELRGAFDRQWADVVGGILREVSGAAESSCGRVVGVA